MATEYIKLARTLPPRLSQFFRRYPPATHDAPELNPFKPTMNQATGKWRNPVFSLRRQADLVKLAKLHNVDRLLPPTVKSEEAREARFLEGKKMKRFLHPKGHKSEKVVQDRVERRRDAMVAMPELIKEWKLSRHGRFWKKWPTRSKK